MKRPMLVVLLLVSVVLASCGGDDDSTDEGGDTVPIDTPTVETGGSSATFGEDGCTVSVVIPDGWVSDEIMAEDNPSHSNFCLANSNDALRCLATVFFGFEMTELGPLESGQITGVFLQPPVTVAWAQENLNTADPSTFLEIAAAGSDASTADIEPFGDETTQGALVTTTGPSGFFEGVDYDRMLAVVINNDTVVSWLFTTPAGELENYDEAVRAIVSSTEATGESCPPPQ